MQQNRHDVRIPLSGKQVRLHRTFGGLGRRALVVPMDHSVTIGPLGGSAHAAETTRMLATAGADAVVMHKGRARTLDAASLGRLSLIVHLSAGTSLAVNTTGKVLVGSATEALALGADMVSVHVNIGSATEEQQLCDLGAVAGECDRLGIPLLAMMYQRGPGVGPEATSVATLSHLAAVATDLGADVVKLDYAGSVAAMNQVVESCPLPILVAGGPAVADDDTAVSFGAEVARSRVAGLSFGRLVFGAQRPDLVTAELAAHLNPRAATGPPALELV